MRVIKRYSNRKLYDTHESRYVTLDQLAELIRPFLVRREQPACVRLHGSPRRL